MIAVAGVDLLAVASPGPAFVATVQLSVQQSRKYGMLQALGLGGAAVVWAAGSMAGLQALMLHAAWLYRALQVAGGIYLLYIGLKSWLHARAPVDLAAARMEKLTAFGAFRRGLLTNLANPKVMVFFSSIFSALLDPAWPGWVRLVVLGIVGFNETAWFIVISLLLSTRRSQDAYRRAKTGIDRVAGSFMLLFGGRLLWGAGFSR